MSVKTNSGLIFWGLVLLLVVQPVADYLYYSAFNSEMAYESNVWSMWALSFPIGVVAVVLQIAGGLMVALGIARLVRTFEATLTPQRRTDV